MSKYDPLREHLARLEDVVWAAKLGEVEAILGSGLPKSAREHRTWWANSGGSLVHQNAWLDAGWRVERTDLPRDVVVFRRLRIGGTSLAGSRRGDGNGRTTSESAGEKALASAMSALRQPVTVTLRAEWTPLGEVHKLPCSSSTIPDGPGVARIVSLHEGRLRAVILDTRGVQAFYRSLRLELKALQTTGAVKNVGGLVERLSLEPHEPMAFDVVQQGNAWLLTDGRGRKADFAADEERTLVAHLLVLQERQAGIDVRAVTL